MVQEKADTLGDVIKNARMEADITMEALAERIGVTERYLYRIENEGKKPSYDVLKKLIRELAIQPDLIFTPKSPSKTPRQKISSVCSATATNGLWRSSKQLQKLLLVQRPAKADSGHDFKYHIR